jgi:hypothetical protein
MHKNSAAQTVQQGDVLHKLLGTEFTCEYKYDGDRVQVSKPRVQQAVVTYCTMAVRHSAVQYMLLQLPPLLLRSNAGRCIASTHASCPTTNTVALTL